MEKSPSSEHSSHSASQEIPKVALNPKVHYCTCKIYPESDASIFVVPDLNPTL
jgi:hypothetical protein